MTTPGRPHGFHPYSSPSPNLAKRVPQPPPGGVMSRPVRNGIRPVQLTTWLMVKDVAKMFGVSPMTVYRLIQGKKLAATKVGRSLRVQQEHAEAYLRENSTIPD